MLILGISAYYHDSSATLLRDGKIIAAAHEERFTRKKHDASFPHKAVEYCLQAGGVKLSELDAVAYYEKPLLKFDRILETYIHTAPFGLSHFVQSFPLWIKQKLFLRTELFKQLKKIDAQFAAEKILFSEHHLSHAASAFFPSPFQEAVVLTLDGVGEWATTSVGIGRGAEFELKKEIHFPHSLGFLYSALTAFCGFKVNSGEYKLMGLAPYGVPRFKETIRKELIEVKDDGSFVLNMRYFAFLNGDKMFHPRMAELFKTPAREPEKPLSQVYMDIAASIQQALEEVLLIMTRHLHSEFKLDSLCLAGGVALNCVANSKILNDGKFKKIWIQPAAGDAGGSLGAALAVHHLHFKKPRALSSEDSMQGAYLGPSYDDAAIIKALGDAKLNGERLTDEQLHRETASVINKGLSVGWFQGPMEFGPRALGGRSILADARDPGMQKKLNLQIKFRESFRPFAPIVLEEDASEWFDFEGPSPYMLFVAAVKKREQALPAVTHLDQSARLQTVSRATNPQLHALLSEFKKLTGCPVLINTSFNVRGEPIVESPADAIRCFLGTDLDVLVLGNHMVLKAAHPHLTPQKYHQTFELD